MKSGKHHQTNQKNKKNDKKKSTTKNVETPKSNAKHAETVKDNAKDKKIVKQNANKESSIKRASSVEIASDNVENSINNHQDESINKSNSKIIVRIILIILVICAVYVASYIWSLYGEQVELEHLLSSVEVSENDIQRTGKTERMLQLEEVKEINPDIVGWLEIFGTKINYPVMQSKEENDKFYLDHNYKKEGNIQGSIYLKKEYNWNIASNNMIIYGQSNTIDGSMFGGLKNYQSEEFYNSHDTFRFTTEDSDFVYEIIGVFSSKEFNYEQYINLDGEKQYDEYVKNVKEHSMYDTGKTAKYGETLISLSTCSNNAQDERFVIVAKQRNEE